MKTKIYKDRKKIKELKTKIGKLKWDIWALLPYRDFAETKKELEVLDDKLNTNKDLLAKELAGVPV